MQGARDGVCLLQFTKPSLFALESSHQQGEFLVLPIAICIAWKHMTCSMGSGFELDTATDTAGFHVQFDNDVYVATSEPHGDIEAVVTRKDAMPHAKL